MQSPAPEIRSYDARDESDLLVLWHETKRDAYPYLPTEQSYTLEIDTAFFRQHIEPSCEIWVAAAGEALLGFLAISGSYVDRLYVHPKRQRAGVGAALTDKAKALSPDGLTLHTHQQNVAACAFYEKHGFVAAEYGTSGPPESVPDVLYRWKP